MPDIRHELIIGESAEKIFDALTTQEGLSGWWTPGTVAIPELESIARFTFGGGYYKEMKIVEFQPVSSVKWKCIHGYDQWVGTSISFRIVSGEFLQSHPEAGDQIQQQMSDVKTLLVFSHSDWREYSAMFAECSYTWGQFLRSLKLYCESGSGKPWPGQHGGKE